MIDKAKLGALIRSPNAKKHGLRLLVAFALITVLGFLVLPPLVKWILVDRLAEALHRPVAIQSISINPYTLSASIEGFVVKEPDGEQTFVGFDGLYLNLESFSLFRGGPVIREIRVVNPKLRVVRLADNRYNFSDLVAEFMAKPKSDGPTPLFSLNNIQLSGGAIEFDDRSLDEKHAISDINLTVPFISNMAYATDSFVEPAFAARVDGALLAFKGKSKPFASSLESEIALDLSDLQLSKYLDYVPLKLPIKLLSGALDTHLKLLFRQEKERPSTLILSGTAAIRDFKVSDLADAPLVSFKQLALALESVDLLNRKFVIERVALEAPEIRARASRQGTLNWLELARAIQPAARPDPAPVAAGEPAPLVPVEWSVAEAKVTGGALRWYDESNAKPFAASIEAIELGVSKLDSKGTVPAAFNLGLSATAGEWLKVESFAVEGGQLALAKREIVIGKASLRGVRGLIRRAADGQIEWLKPPALHAAAETGTAQPSTPWTVTVDKNVGEDIGIRFEDASLTPAAVQNVDGFGFEIDNLSTDPDRTAKLAARLKLNGKGEIAVDGTVKPFPLAADLTLDIKTLGLLSLQPYFSEKLNIAVTQGQVSMKGALKLHRSEAPSSGGLPAGADGFTGGFLGQATVGDFRAVDKLNSAEFLRWKSFHFDKVDARLNPDSVSIGDVALADFFARIIVSAEGKLNLMQIVRTDDAAALPSAAPAADQAAPAAAPSGGKATAPVVAERKPVMPLKIGKITLQGGSVRFSDNFVKPNYSANLRGIGGRITGLSSEAGTVAGVEVRGSYDNVAPINITAQINPLSAKPYLDLQAEVKGIELTSLSAYSAKYAGYAIEKGKLSLFVKYKIENDLLVAENRVFLDQLTFGEPVDSPDATSLPVTLAVSLLKNRNGEIDINLPISGSLNDPQFSIGGLVVRVIVNLLVKAVTSPFALIGSMFGSSGEELSNIEFDYGRAAITSAAQPRLENLAKALVDRPGLKLEIEARIDSERDREGLKSARIERKVRALKREDLAKNGTGGDPGDAIEVSPQEYPALLERVYRAEKFPKPRNMIGLVKSIPLEEMEKLILANSTVDDDDLRGLGDRRAKVVRDWLVEHEVPAERIFMLPSKLGAADAESGSGEKIKGSRVDFLLK